MTSAERGPFRVVIQTDGTAKNSQASWGRRGEESLVPANRIMQASASVRTERGIRIITATIWERVA